MPFYSDTLTNEVTGLPIEGAQVYVYTYGGDSEAVIKNGAGAVLQQPLITNQDGGYEFWLDVPDYVTIDYWVGGRKMFRNTRAPVGSTDYTDRPTVAEVKALLPEYLLSSFDGANDEARLIAAALEVSTAGGGVIVIENDLECDGLSFPNTRTNVTLRGANPQTTIRLTTTASRALYIQGAGWRLENLTIEVQGNATSAAIEVRGGNFSADNVVFDFGVAVSNSVGLNFAQGASNCLVTNCRFIDGELQVIAQTGANNIKVDNCSFTGGAHKGVVARGNAAGGGNMLLTNCTFIENGIDCQPVRAEYASHDFPGVIVSGCTFIDTVKRAGGNEDTVSFNGVSNFRSVGNYIKRASDVGVNASTGATDGVIANNVIIGTYNGAVNLGQLSGDTQALAASRTRRVLVANNIAIDCGDRWDNPTLGTNSPYVYYMALRTTDCSFIGNVGYVSGNQIYAPIRGALFGDNVGLTWLDNHLTGWTDAVEFSNIATDSAINGGGAIGSTFAKVNGKWPYDPTMTGSPAGSTIYNGALKLWDGSAWSSLSARARRKAIATSGTTPTFTFTGDITGTRTGVGVYVYTFTTALANDDVPSVFIPQAAGRTSTLIIAPDRLSITVYTWTTTTANDSGHELNII